MQDGILLVDSEQGGKHAFDTFFITFHFVL
jgi:hypothetical protein